MTTEKQKQLMEELFHTLEDEDEKYIFSEVIYYLLELGYAPIRCKTSDVCLDFSHPKLKQKIAKFRKNEIKLKFYTSSHYSKKFSNAVKTVIEEYDGRYTGCYGCGKCNGNLKGYTYQYPDGRTVFRCGSELLAVTGLEKGDVSELKHLIYAQHLFFIEQCSETKM